VNHLRQVLLCIAGFVCLFAARFSAVAAGPPTLEEQASAVVVADNYFKFDGLVDVVELQTPSATNSFSIGTSGAVFWKWSAPATGVIQLKNGAQDILAPPSAVTYDLAWPLPTYDDPKGVSPDLEIGLRDGSATGPGGGSGGVITVHLGPPSPPFSGDLRVYSANDDGSLIEVGGLGNDLSSYFRVLSGQVLFLRFQPPQIAFLEGPGSFLFTPAPTNDAFTDRLPLVGVSASATGHNVGATPEADDPATNGPTRSTVWWTWTAPDYGNAFFSYRNPERELGLSSMNDFLLSFYKGSELGSLKFLGSTTNLIKFPVAPGDTFQIAVDSLGSVGPFTFSVFLDFLPPVIDPATSRRMPDGSFRIEALQLRGRPFSVVATEDWTTWETIWSGVINGDTATFRDYWAATRVNVFYFLQLPTSYQYGGGAATP
jgi:hypothetical protein